MWIDSLFVKMKQTSDVNWEFYSVNSSCFANLAPIVSNLIKEMGMETFELPVYSGPVFNEKTTPLLISALSKGKPYIHFKLPATIPFSERDHFSENLYVKLIDIIDVIEQKALDLALEEEPSVKTSWMKGLLSKVRPWMLNGGR